MSLKRRPVNKSRSASKFRKQASKTKAANVPSKRTIMRGGQRM